MTEQEMKGMSLFDILASTQETFEEAKKRNSEENGNHVNYLRFKSDGTYTVRILPLAPVINADGEVLPMERKGYEYPLRSLILKIAAPQTDEKGKPKIIYANVCNAKHTFKDKIKSDVIDAYVNRACELYANDEKLCKKLRETSFNGGLRWDSKRCMYVLDLDNPNDGVKILQLSYPQFKDLEERKLNVWNKLNKDGKKVGCPISSIDSAYPIEIVRKTEGGKASYSFNIDTLSGKHVLEEKDIQKLFDAPRLPEVLYRYTRFHLEATIAYLSQLDEQYDIDVLKDEEVQNCIEQIKLLLPADDQSHFTIGRAGNDGNSTESAASETIDSLWDRYDSLSAAGLDDKSAEGQELRTSIKEYIEDHDMNIRISHTKSNADILQEIDEVLAEEEGDEEKETPATEPAKRKDVPAVEEDDDEEPAAPSDEDDAEEEPAAPAPTRTRERNEDTNEPAVRSERRSARTLRRR